ncbi:elongation factor P--(R)-beta-lysine ligase [endosymbiont of Sipalinus gigas]|uniref:elongation factor P--(R)-beta-lysine ligase n=1 Tax=endosymbiont of Sipalinus gigas TaxID=1972134 RepID=UPI000DC716A5|nr:elongation factor P--(R)-beta-lysine ligase [endosymbiont of Sipalinus gigas]BBA85330.1 elongation factor P--(R)-beta-lysine ligase [endosymbiont of Sipalinus gigas]
MIKKMNNISFKNLIKRSFLINKIRNFFLLNDYIEVETPLISKFSDNNNNLNPIDININNNKYYLITSPEFHMKRLLSRNPSKSIFQICHSFRNNEYGKYHNIEFTILEWYKLKSNLFDIMNETDLLLKNIFNYKKSKFIKYIDIFYKYLNINPLYCNNNILINILKKNNISVNKIYDLDSLLELTFDLLIKPKIGHKNPIFIYFFPKNQSFNSTINKKNNLSNRFEVYFKGIELANGFNEITDYLCQKKILEKQNEIRFKKKLPIIKIDKNFIYSIKKGIPKCSGVSLGIDRLIMIYLNLYELKNSISFDFYSS